MKLAEISKDTVYTDNCGRFRRLIDFLDGDLEGMVLYEKGYFDKVGNWRYIGELADCKVQSFATWAKDRVETARS